MTSTATSIQDAPTPPPVNAPDLGLLRTLRRLAQLLLLGAVIVAGIAGIATIRERSAYANARDSREAVVSFDRTTEFSERVEALIARDNADVVYEDRHERATALRGYALIAVFTAAPAFIAWMVLLTRVAGRSKGRRTGALTAAAIWVWFVPPVSLFVPPLLLHNAASEGWDDDPRWTGREVALYAAWWFPWIISSFTLWSRVEDAPRGNSIRALIRTSTSHDATGSTSSMVWTMALLVIAGIGAVAVVETTTRHVARRIARSRAISRAT